MKHNYFGTDTRSAGHYFWILGEGQYDADLRQFEELPFNPEEFTRISKYDYKKKGEVEFHFIDGYSILAIAGSPIDSRPGCKSVFFFKEKLSEKELIEKVKSIPAAMRIINSMPFDVKIEGLKDTV